MIILIIIKSLIITIIASLIITIITSLIKIIITSFILIVIVILVLIHNFRFVTGNPRNDLHLDGTYLTIEQAIDNSTLNWNTVYTDKDWEAE